MGYYPWLSAQNVAYILLETANDQGEYADSAKYGQGALDLEAADTTPDRRFEAGFIVIV